MIHASDLALDYQQHRALNTIEARMNDNITKLRDLLNDESYQKPEHAVGDMLDDLHQTDLYIRIIARNRWGMGT
jgi:hypothetical protein